VNNLILKKGNVVFSKQTNRKEVIFDEREIKEDETFVCDKPHQDEDFSYSCWRDYCRCMQ